jgi:hypothetical protein
MDNSELFYAFHMNRQGCTSEFKDEAVCQIVVSLKPGWLIQGRSK